MVNLGSFCKNKNTEQKLIVHMALTFRTNLSTLSKLLNKDENDLYNEFMYQSSDEFAMVQRALNYLFYHDYADQDEAKTKFERYANKLSQVLSHSYDDKRKGALVKKYVLSEIDDSRVNNRFKDKPKEKYSEEDIVALINWQLKYGATQEIVSKTFGISRSNYQERLLNVIKTHPELKSRYEALATYNETYILKKR